VVYVITSEHDDLVTTARTYTHVLVDERELDYGGLLV
jgi:CTP synthase (UTP-ammonia lyase)